MLMPLDILLRCYPGDSSKEGVMPRNLATCFPAMLSLIADIGRRAVLQLAALRRWPKTETVCCKSKHCFKCKVSGHHDGVSCEEVQRHQIEGINEDGESGSIQFCPACGVATLKTEGCNEMICLCGQDWTWDGKEVWVDEWIDRDGADSDDY
jgi:hypothetical protein